MIKISAVIITFNEEQHIGRCLESLRDIVDEIMVVDSFSTDNTKAICEQYAARFIQHSFAGYIEQKNYAIQQATHDIVLSLDADEVLSDNLREAILKVKGKWAADGYYSSRTTFIGNRPVTHGSWYPDYKLRLYDRRKGSFGGTNPHDHVVMVRGAKIKKLPGTILHYSFETIDDFYIQSDKFAQHAATAMYNKGKKTNLFLFTCKTIWAFCKSYIVKLGFIDGKCGLLIATGIARSTFKKYTLLRRRYRQPSTAMKVCFFNGAKLWGGGEKWHFDHALGFLQEGCEAVVVSAGNSELLKRAAAAGIRTKIFSVGNLSFLNVFKLRLIYNFFRKEKFDVLVMNFSKDLKVAAYMAKCAGIPKIVYRRGSDIPIKNTYLNRFLYGKCVTDILVNSEATRRSVLKNNSKLFPADKIKVIYNGINTRVPECTKPANEVPVVGTLSRFVYQKGIDILLDIALILKKRGVRCKIKIGGAGALKDDLLHQAKANDLLDYVDFTGFVDNPNDFMCGLDIFVLTSRWEGFGYVLAEAMLAKKPLVAFDISSNPELVFNNVNGFLIPFENKVAFADAIEELLKQPQQRIKFGNAGQAIVREKFDFETNKQLVIDYLS